MPAPSAPQNTSFSPALNRRAGACLDLMKPPPCLNHSMSVLSGMLSLMKIATISTRPTTNAKLVKLCAYLAASENALNARSEERRVGKEGKSRWWRAHGKKEEKSKEVQ